MPYPLLTINTLNNPLIIPTNNTSHSKNILLNRLPLLDSVCVQPTKRVTAVV